MPKLSPLVEEMLAAGAAIVALDTLIAFLYWVFTDLSPWPFIILAEAVTFGPGVAILSLTSPRRTS
jgi:hypothetical protein